MKLVKSDPWSENDIDKVLSSLKKNKSRDPYNFINDIFKVGVVGTDLKNSMLLLFNKIKSEIEIPKLLHPVNIISIYKGKGKKDDLKNDKRYFHYQHL